MGKKKEYEKALEELQIELVGLTRWLRMSGKRMVVIFEGRDAAGKGGTIKAITDKLDTRAARVVALGKPSPDEDTQWYFQRYVEHLPQAGELVLFDRSWYNRAVVEPAMGFCTDKQYDAFMKACPTFEKLLTDDGILLFKYWLSVDQDEQEERFAERAADPLKRWKLSPVDLKAREKYVEIGDLRDAMIQHTDSHDAPWFVVDFNNQKRGRLNLIRHLLDQIPDKLCPDKEFDLPPLKGKLKKDKVTAKAERVPEVY
ncbi:MULTISPECIES: polyphosphate kinase 2 [Luteibacter]|uniref:ADP/GDP-polyphosphate phosphotransferase n=1 Tax=Luteibacter flocculans TaxID=2780091 RepID=A0ABY4T3H0_9GAMM|nr:MULTISPECIES: polyphosphate kinase 2 [Luteibacter]URL59225.1 polyphosphate kinase 2 [Luteibacter flocculans]SFW58857.1 polyphosphate kinase 2, PA0141 family [Luteibacter sp. UNCMF366Tsu5.1]